MISADRCGEVTERLKVLASKASVGETPPWVQIPPSPPFSLRSPQGVGGSTFRPFRSIHFRNERQKKLFQSFAFSGIRLLQMNSHVNAARQPRNRPQSGKRLRS